MKIDITKYLQDKYKEEQSRSFFPGPVVTLSRELGCPSKKIAHKLMETLNESGRRFKKRQPWRWISKEIMEESARELGVDLAEIEYVFDYKQHGVIEDLLLAHSRKFYKTDRKVRNTIARVIRNFGEEGNAIIVGRGGVAICRDIPKSLHIHLEAPLEWRALRTSEKHNLNIDEARRYCLDIDAKRKKFREYFEGKGSDYTRFDMKFNCMTIDIDEVVKIIVGAMEVRGLI